MKNYRTCYPNVRYFSLWGLIAMIVLLNACALKPKPFKTAYVFTDSFFDHKLRCDECAGSEDPCTTLKAYYLGFRQQYDLNNDLFELSNVPSHISVLNEVSDAIDSANSAHHNKFISPKDSDEIFIIEIDKSHCFEKEDAALFRNGPGIYYLMLSLKYSPFRASKDSPQHYKVTGLGHAYLGQKSGVNDILFFSEPNIKRMFKHKFFLNGLLGTPQYYSLKPKAHDKTMMLMEQHFRDSELFEKYFRGPSDAFLTTTSKAVSSFNIGDTIAFKKIVATEEKVRRDNLDRLNFTYMVIGNDNQIGGSKYLDIDFRKVFSKKYLRFYPYSIDSLKLGKYPVVRNILVNDTY